MSRPFAWSVCVIGFLGALTTRNGDVRSEWPLNKMRFWSSRHSAPTLGELRCAPTGCHYAEVNITTW